MNFRTFTAGGSTFTAEQQADAFEAYIAQDKYLSAHRGEYAERGAVFLPLLHKLDLSLTQDVFKNIKGRRNAGQFRIDIQNCRQPAQLELGRRPARHPQQHPDHARWRMPPAACSYRMQVVNNQLVRRTFESDQRLARRLPVHAQLPLFVQLTGFGLRPDRLAGNQAGGSKTTRPFSLYGAIFLL